jgi:hypothetical protein
MLYVLPKVILSLFNHGEWAGRWHVAYMGEKRNFQKRFVGKSEVKRSLERFAVVWQDCSQN